MSHGSTRLSDACYRGAWGVAKLSYGVLTLTAAAQLSYYVEARYSEIFHPVFYAEAVVSGATAIVLTALPYEIGPWVREKVCPALSVFWQNHCSRINSRAEATTQIDPQPLIGDDHV